MTSSSSAAAFFFALGSALTLLGPARFTPTLISSSDSDSTSSSSGWCSVGGALGFVCQSSAPARRGRAHSHALGDEPDGGAVLHRQLGEGGAKVTPSGESLLPLLHTHFGLRRSQGGRGALLRRLALAQLDGGVTGHLRDFRIRRAIDHGEGLDGE